VQGFETGGFLTRGFLTKGFEFHLGFKQRFFLKTEGFLKHRDYLKQQVTNHHHNTCRDLKRMRQQAGTFFNALFNLHKFLNFENRDPFAARAENLEYAGLSEWDKFAKIEYFR
jgi:hypothetical protein